MEARFGRSRLVATALRILARVVLVIGLLSGLAALVAVAASGVLGAQAVAVPPRVAAFGGLFTLIAALLSFTLLSGAAELIHLLLAIDAHARQIVERLNAPDDEP